MSSILDMSLNYVDHIEKMRSNISMDKEACLDSMRSWTCSLIQRFISEPYCTSFTLPKPSDLVTDEVMSKSTEDELLRHMDTASRQVMVEED